MKEIGELLALDYINEYDDLKAMFNLGKKLASTPSEELTLSGYFLRTKILGSFYGLEDANKDSLDSSMTRLEALYNLSGPSLSAGLTGGMGGSLDKRECNWNGQREKYCSVTNLLGVQSSIFRNEDGTIREDEYERLIEQVEGEDVQSFTLPYFC